MPDIEAIMQVVFGAIDEVNLAQPADAQLQRAPDEIILGHKAKLDSMGMATLLASVEERVHEAFGARIDFFTEATMDESGNVLKNVVALSAFVADRLAEAEGG